MSELLIVVKIALYVLMAASILAALGVVLLPNIFHAALCLVAALIGVAGIYLAIHAEFIAIVQILIYVGAVMTLVIFAIMMTGNIAEKNISQTNNLRVIAFGASVLFLVIMVKLILKTPWPVRPENLAEKLSITKIGRAMMETYVFPFEVISVVLIAALIGSLIVAKREHSS